MRPGEKRAGGPAGSEAGSSALRSGSRESWPEVQVGRQGKGKPRVGPQGTPSHSLSPHPFHVMPPSTHSIHLSPHSPSLGPSPNVPSLHSKSPPPTEGPLHHTNVPSPTLALPEPPSFYPIRSTLSHPMLRPPRNPFTIPPRVLSRQHQVLCQSPGLLSSPAPSSGSPSPHSIIVFRSQPLGAESEPQN